MPKRMMDMLNNKTRENFLLGGMDDFRTIGMGKIIKSRSVIMSAVPMVINCT